MALCQARILYQNHSGDYPQVILTIPVTCRTVETIGSRVWNWASRRVPVINSNRTRVPVFDFNRTRVPVFDSTEREFLSSTPSEREFLSSTPLEREFLSSTSEAVERSSHHLLFRFEGEVWQQGLPTRPSGDNEAASAVSCGDLNAVPEFSESLRRPIRQED